MITAETVTAYTEKLASNLPAPGGGSAAALAGALGAACGCMVGNFTVGKKKFADVEAEVAPHLQALDELRQEMLELVAADVTAYSAVGAAYGLPKDTDEQRAARESAIQEALVAAAGVPMALARCAAAVAEHLPPLLAKGNPNLVSDVGVAARLAEAACECAWLNVEVNVAVITNQSFVAASRAEAEGHLRRCREICQVVWDGTVTRILSP
jgi:formiminotetrahydrofolate cyclodeaminase